MNINGQELTPLQEQLFILRGMGLGEIADEIYAAFLAGAEHAGAKERERILAIVVKLKEWCRDCQIEKEKAGENEKPDFIRQSILWDLEKEIRRLPAALEAESK